MNPTLYLRESGKTTVHIADYRNCLGKMLTYLGDVYLRTVGVTRMREFFAHLNTDYTTMPGCCAPAAHQKLSDKTIRNIHAACSSFSTWVVEEELHRRNPMDHMQRPKGDPPPITPFTEREIKALLAACDTPPPGTTAKRSPAPGTLRCATRPWSCSSSTRASVSVSCAD